MLAFTFKAGHLYHLTLVPNVTRQVTAVFFKSKFLSPVVSYSLGFLSDREERDLSPLPRPSFFSQVFQVVFLPKFYYILCKERVGCILHTPAIEDSRNP